MTFGPQNNQNIRSKPTSCKPGNGVLHINCCGGPVCGLCCSICRLPPDLQTYGIHVAVMLPVHASLSALTEAAQVLVSEHLQKMPPVAVVLWLAIQMVPADSQERDICP